LKTIIKLFSSISLVLFASYSVFIGLLLFYYSKVVKGRIKMGMDIPYFPIVIGLIIFCLAIWCLFIKKIPARAENRPSAFRWIWLFLAVVILYAGFCLTLIAIFKPNAFGYSEGALPGLASLFWLSSIVVSILIFYKVSTMNSEAYPNLMRYVVFVLTFLTPTYTLILSLILVYSIPGKISYVFWAAIISFGSLPTSLAILGIARDYFPPPPNNIEG